MHNMMTTCSYFDNLNFNMLDAMVPNATLSRLHCVLADFHVSNDT